MNLEPVAVVLQFVRPAGTAGRLLGDDWLTRMNESGLARLMACRESYATTCRRYKRSDAAIHYVI
jgi:hypothetical protein